MISWRDIVEILQRKYVCLASVKIVKMFKYLSQASRHSFDLDSDSNSGGDHDAEVTFSKWETSDKM